MASPRDAMSRRGAARRTVVVSLAVAAAVAVLGGCRHTEPSPTVSRPGGSGQATPSPITGATSGLPPPVAAIKREPGPNRPLAVGECADIDGLRAGEVIPPGNLVPVACDGPHRVEVYAVLTHPADGRFGYPGARQMMAFVDDHCLSGFEPYIGTPYDRSAFDQTTVQPTEKTWRQGDRAVECIVYDGDFAVLAAPARSSAR